MAFDDDDFSDDWGDSDTSKGYGGGDDRNYDPEQTDFSGDDMFGSEDSSGGFDELFTEDDAATKWLEANDPKVNDGTIVADSTRVRDRFESSDYITSTLDIDAIGSPAYALKKGQLSHQDYNVQLEVERAIAGEADWSKAGLDGLSIAGALDANARAMRGGGR